MCVSWVDREAGGCDTNVRLFWKTAKKVKQDRSVIDQIRSLSRALLRVQATLRQHSR